MARILIVEDVPVNAEMATIICRAAGHEVVVACDGQAALAWLEAESFDLVLSDVIMPVMDGLRMTQAIRGSGKPYADIPILGMTARADKAGLARVRAAGMDEVLTKPYRNRDLVAAIAALLDPEAGRVTICRLTAVEDVKKTG
jgi:CheY-like chemotaxis protein